MKKSFLLFTITFFGLTALGQVSQTVTVEHFTNTRCSICASKNPAFFDLLDDYPEVIHIAYHPSAPYSSCIFSQHNPSENDEKKNYYNIYGCWLIARWAVHSSANRGRE